MTSPIVARVHPPVALARNEGSGNDGQAPIRRLLSAVWKHCQPLLPIDTRIPLWAKETKEPVLATLGPVEIRRTTAGCFAETCAKGELTGARATALLRLTRFIGGDNRRGVKIAAERPLVLRRKAPGLWQFLVRLSDIECAAAVPIPRTRKVRVIQQEPATYAVIVCRGYPSERGIQRAELAILDAIARSPWFACGSPVGRIFAPSAVLPFLGNFEVAVPVVAHVESDGDSTYEQGIERTFANRPASPPSLPAH